MQAPPSSHRSAALWLRKWWPVVLLGISTVGTYGVGWYSFGVIIGPVKEETGWSSSSISAAFSIGVLFVGVGAIFAGQMLDRFGGRPVQIVSLLAGTALVLVAVSAHSLPVFVAAWGLGAGVLGAGLFYHVTMAITTRLYPDERAAAFAVLTFTGGFASPVYLPVAGYLVEEFGWRAGVRLLVLLMVVLAVPAALLVSGNKRDNAAPFLAGPLQVTGKATNQDLQAGAGSGFGSVREALRSKRVAVMVLMFAAMWVAVGGMQVHQVPAIQAAGVSLATASFIAGLRGFMSLPGRAMLGPITKWLGIERALLVAYALMFFGLVALAFGGFAGAMAFAVVTGVVFGVVSPLQGLYSAEVYGQRRIGSLLGAQQAVINAASATGPVVLSLLLDAGAGYRTVVGVAAGMVAVAIMLELAGMRRAGSAKQVPGDEL